MLPIWTKTKLLSLLNELMKRVTRKGRYRISIYLNPLQSTCPKMVCNALDIYYTYNKLLTVSPAK